MDTGEEDEDGDAKKFLCAGMYVFVSGVWQ